MAEKALTMKNLSEDMKTRIVNMMNRTWNYIGYDVLEGNEGKSMPRSHVIEIVCDADFMYYHGEDKEAYEVFKKVSYNTMLKLGKLAFPYKRYGM